MSVSSEGRKQVWARPEVLAPGATPDWLIDTVERLQANALKERVAAPLLHDLRNLLTCILGLAEAARAGLDRGVDIRVDLDGVISAATSAAALTNSHLSTGARRRRPRAPGIALQSVVHDVVSLFPDSASLPIVFKRASGLPRVAIAPEAAERVVLNLVSNARDAMPGGGRVTVGLELAHVGSPPSAPGEPTVGRYVVLSVGDEGPGMSAEVLNHAFVPAFTTKDGGTGLGLSFVARTMVRVGGHVGLSTAPGEGTTVRCYFPPVTA